MTTRHRKKILPLTVKQMSSLRAIFILTFVFLLPLPASAWNSAGHRLIAAIAWEQIDESTRPAVIRILQAHPDYLLWIANAKDDAPERAAFIEAATWPDNIRQDSRFYTPNEEEPTPLLPGFPDMQRHRDWHYVNLSLDRPNQPAISGQFDKQLAALSKTLASPTSSLVERSYALPWLIHLVGDAHQPLHASTRRDPANPQSDLAIALIVSNPFNPRKSTTTLHAYWDDLPGPPWLRGTWLNKASKALLVRHPKPAPSTPAQWLQESWQIAKDSAYPPETETPPTISEAFYESSREIADRRITEAGYRLGELLHNLLGTGASEKKH